MGALIRKSTGPAGGTPNNGGEQWVDSADLDRLKMTDETGLVHVLSTAGWRDNNFLLNGEFDLAQRQVPGTLTTYSNTAGRSYGADRWGMTNENASLQYQRVDTTSAPEAGLQSRYYGKFKKITAAGKFIASQVIEAGTCLHLRGRTVRFQCKMKFSVAASMVVRLALLQLTSAGTVDTIPATFVSAFGAVGVDPTWGTNLAAITPITAYGGSISGAGISCTLTNSWALYGGTFLLPSNFKNLIPVIFTNGQPAAADELNLSEVGLYDGQELRDWMPRNQQEQIAQCQRFCCKTFPIDTGPAQNAGLAGSERAPVVVAGAVATSWNGAEWQYQVQMRGAPTLTFYNPSAANAFVRNVTLATDATVTAGANISERSAHLNCTGLAAWAVGNDAAVHILADAEL